MSVRNFIVLWVVFTAIEVLLVGKFDTQETPVGAAVGALAAYGVLAATRAGGQRYAFRWSWLRIVPVLLVHVVRDTALVFGALLRRCAGGPLPHDRILEIPFDPGGDDPQSVTRRALAIEAVSFAPNSIVLDVDRPRGIMRVHYLLSDVKPPASREWPV